MSRPFLGLECPAAGPCRPCSAVVVELEGDVEVGAAEKLLHRLQIGSVLGHWSIGWCVLACG